MTSVNLNSAPGRATTRNSLGGTKKKSMAQMEKEQESRDSVDQQGQPQKGKKPKEQKAQPQQQKKLPFLVPKMSDEEMVKSLSPLKAITVFAASRALGVNASIATGVLKSLEGKNLIARVGGFSGHYVWAIPQKI
jgi:small subunit ribosomal protein S25e